MRGSVLYRTYQAYNDFLLPFRALARTTQAAFGWVNGEASHDMMRRMNAGLELFDRLTLTHERPDYKINSVVSGNREVAVRQEAAAVTPFGTLLHFRKEMDAPQPRVLIVAPLSGHF